VFERDRVIFVGRHFLLAFSSRDDTARDARADSGSSFIRKTEQRRAQFVAEVFDRRRN
jgi:hypothetical protein